MCSHEVEKAILKESSKFGKASMNSNGDLSVFEV